MTVSASGNDPQRGRSGCCCSSYLRPEVGGDPQGELSSGWVLPEVQQARRLSVVQRGRLPVVGDGRVTVVHGRLPVISEGRMAVVRFDVLSGFNL